MIPINFRNVISRHRDAIMGLMALLIVVFHAHLPISNAIYRHTIGAHGSIGVDVFVFISGFGLAHALERSDNVGRYLSRRFSRILPAYYAYLICVIALWLLFGKNRDRGMSEYLLYWSIPVGEWVNRAFPRWYVSGAMGYYVIALITYPALRRSRWLYLTTAALLLLTGWYIPVVSQMENSILTLCRLPVLMVGLASGCAAQREEPRYRQGWLGLAGLTALFALGALLFAFGSRLNFPGLRQISEREANYLCQAIMAPMLTVGMAYALEGCGRLRMGWIDRALSRVGKCSLEIYLVHYIYREVFSRTTVSPYIAALVILAASYPSALLLQWFAQKLLCLWRKVIAHFVAG